MARKKLKMIAVSWENYNELKEWGQTGDSMNDALTRLLKAAGIDVTGKVETWV